MKILLIILFTLIMNFIVAIITAIGLQGRSSDNTLEYWSKFPGTLNGDSAIFIKSCKDIVREFRWK